MSNLQIVAIILISAVALVAVGLWATRYFFWKDYEAREAHRRRLTGLVEKETK